MEPGCCEAAKPYGARVLRGAKPYGARVLRGGKALWSQGAVRRQSLMEPGCCEAAKVYGVRTRQRFGVQGQCEV